MTTAHAIRVQHLSPVLVVHDIEPCLGFWTDRLGFTAENQVADDGGSLVFASVTLGDVEVMYQSRARVIAERPDAAAELVGHSTILFITVDDLDQVEKALAGLPLVTPRHDTVYGSTEIYLREPGGNIVGFAQFKK
jgi:uncharacterized glyoxalase superfamily protein PhnB